MIIVLACISIWFFLGIALALPSFIMSGTISRSEERFREANGIPDC